MVEERQPKVEISTLPDDPRRPRTEEDRGRRLGDARRRRHGGHVERADVDQVEQQVEEGHRARAEDQAAGKAPAGIAHLARRAGEAVPAVVGPERRDHRDSEGGEEAAGNRSHRAVEVGRDVRGDEEAERREGTMAPIFITVGRSASRPLP